ncbi:hypothetical protein NQ317_012018 [Molorchus minor]|uniref:RCC1-like G exchanging factor-like protein n=1 Tax=Molorchus minor TaxID=1323400 RepID=A0ABQ9K1S6_9CUCU|nr:hypothetical protein NQ317_012018 [Molorchus minor]
MNSFKRIVNTIATKNRRFLSTKKRKYPIQSEDAEKLPVFQYSVSKEGYRRVFAWGNIQTGALGIQYIKRNENPEKVAYIKNPKRIGFGEKFQVKAAACGFGFTIFAINSKTDNKIYGCGINTDSQIGYHEIRHQKPLGLLFSPRPIPLPFLNPEKCEILKVAAGRAHTLILTTEGIFTLGNNAYGQCGRKIIPDENYTMSNYINHIENIDGKRIIDIECGQDHSLALTEDGCVYSCGWGADGQTGLGHFVNAETFSRVKGDIESEKITKLSCRSDFVLALNEKGDIFGWGNIEYSQITLPDGSQQLANPKYINMFQGLGRIKSIASAGSFCVIVNEHGQVYSWGYGLLGTGPEVQQSKIPVLIPETLFGKNDFQPENIVNKVVCGLNYVAAVTSSGDLYTWGRNKSCCLGLGNEKDQYFPLKVAMGGHVQNVFCGIDHTIAICKPFI